MSLRGCDMARRQMNIRLDSLTIEAIKRIAAEHNMSESQVITRAVILLEQELKRDAIQNDRIAKKVKSTDRKTGS